MLLALDIATVTGWAIGDPFAHRAVTPLEAASNPPAPPEFGSTRVGEKGARLARVLDGYRGWLNGMIDAHGITVIFYEAPYVTDRKAQDTGRMLSAFAGLTDLIALDRKLPIWEVNISHIRMHFIGCAPKRAKAKKLTMEACYQRRWSVTDDNEADALALFDYAAAWLQRRRNAA